MLAPAHELEVRSVAGHEEHDVLSLDWARTGIMPSMGRACPEIEGRIGAADGRRNRSAGHQIETMRTAHGTRRKVAWS
jgi:hypothetical protein